MDNGNLFSKVRYGRNRNLGGEVGDVVYRLKLYNEKGTQGDTAETASVALLLMVGDDWMQMKLFNNMNFDGPISYVFEEDSNGQSYASLYIIPNPNETTQLSERVDISSMVRNQIINSNFHGHIQLQGHPEWEFKRR
ncbi:hypothetical protein IWW42_002843 [Coemansia sp. RSA 1085]|nr:hypothetical protein IWW42_002843 [Coemansia sp. RSA 1085]